MCQLTVIAAKDFQQLKLRDLQVIVVLDLLQLLFKLCDELLEFGLKLLRFSAKTMKHTIIMIHVTSRSVAIGTGISAHFCSWRM